VLDNAVKQAGAAALDALDHTAGDAHQNRERNAANSLLDALDDAGQGLNETGHLAEQQLDERPPDRDVGS
jgi:hypothetical protein